jgi:hypothetical protein
MKIIVNKKTVDAGLWLRTSTDNHKQDPKGARTGRPRVTSRSGFEQRFALVLNQLNAGVISGRRAVHNLVIGYAILKRLLDKKAIELHEKTG